MTAHIKKTTEEVIETTLWHEDQISKLKEKIIKELKKHSYHAGLNDVPVDLVLLDRAIKIVEQA